MQSAFPSSQERSKHRTLTLASTEGVVRTAPIDFSYGLRAESSASHESPKMMEKKVMRSSTQGKDLGGGVTKSNGRDKNVGPVTKVRISASAEDPEDPASGKTRKGGAAREGCGTGRQGGRLEEESQGLDIVEREKKRQQEGFVDLLKSASKER